MFTRLASTLILTSRSLALFSNQHYSGNRSVFTIDVSLGYYEEADWPSVHDRALALAPALASIRSN